MTTIKNYLVIEWSDLTREQKRFIRENHPGFSNDSYISLYSEIDLKALTSSGVDLLKWVNENFHGEYQTLDDALMGDTYSEIIFENSRDLDVGSIDGVLLDICW